VRAAFPQAALELGELGGGDVERPPVRVATDLPHRSCSRGCGAQVVEALDLTSRQTVELEAGRRVYLEVGVGHDGTPKVACAVNGLFAHECAR